MKKLQVLLNNEWQYVFCRNELKKLPVTTKEKKKAITERFGDGQKILDYFSKCYGSLEFRLQ